MAYCPSALAVIENSCARSAIGCMGMPPDITSAASAPAVSFFQNRPFIIYFLLFASGFVLIVLAEYVL